MLSLVPRGRPLFQYFGGFVNLPVEYRNFRLGESVRRKLIRNQAGSVTKKVMYWNVLRAVWVVALSDSSYRSSWCWTGAERL